MEYDGIEPVSDEDEVFSFIKAAILTPGATERTHRFYVRAQTQQNSAEKQV